MTALITVTTLPHPGLVGSEDFLGLSVALGPQVPGGGRLPGALVNWPRTLKDVVVTAEIRAHGVVTPHRGPDISTRTLAEPMVWDAMLTRQPLDPHHVPVDSARFHSFDAASLEKSARSTYDRRKTGGGPQPLADGWFEADDNFRDFQKFHGLVQAPTPLADPRPSMNPRDLGFHQVVAAAASHPALLERLGLVFYVVVKVPLASLLIASPGGKVEVRVILGKPPTLPDAAWVPALSPWTAIEIRGTGVGAHGTLVAVPTARAREPEADGGFVRLGDPEIFRTTTVDVDGFGVGVHAKLTSGTDRPPLPALRSAGIGVIRQGRIERERAALVRAQELREKIQALAANPAGNAPTLFAEDVVRGMRVDVAEVRADAPRPWRSLCWRHGKYSASADSLPYLSQFIPPFDVYDEGLVQASLTETPRTGALLLAHEVMFRWDGWSLALPRPGKFIDHDGKLASHDSAAKSPLPVTGRFELSDRAEHRLPRLRFGRRYRVRARHVDAAGVSISVSQADALAPNAKDAVVETDYLRTDPIPAPTLISASSLDPAENADRLLIRTRTDGPEPAPARRFVLPPPCTLTLAEQHGMLDRFASPEDSYARLAAVDAKRKTMAPRPGQQIVVDTNAFRDGVLHYYPDPAARGVLVLFELPGKPRTITNYAFDWDVGWPSCRPILIELRAGVGTPSYDGNTRTLSVFLAAGTRGWLEIQSYVEKDAFGRHFSDLGLGRDPRTGKLIGELTPNETVYLVHAQQQPQAPLVAGAGGRLVAARKAGSQWATFDQTVTLGDGTGVLRVDASWLDPNDGPNGLVQTPGSAPIGERALDVDSPDVTRKSPPSVISLGMEHAFPDARRRDLTVRLTADSLFRDLFPGVPTARTTDGVQIIVPSAARPPSPEIASIVPLLEWSEKVEPGLIQHERRSECLRVFVQRPWFVSGPGERIGVVFATNPLPVVDPDAPDADVALLRGMGPYVTQWAADPVWGSRWNADASRWEGRPSVRGPRMSDFESGAFKSRVQIVLPGAGPGGAPVPLSEPVDLATYDVSPRDNWDSERQAWFADVRFRSDSEICQGYFPFVRLALVRYQPESVDSLHASPVVVAMPVQLLPKRTLVVRPRFEGQVQVIEIQLNGPAPVWTGVQLGGCEVVVEERLPTGTWTQLDESFTVLDSGSLARQSALVTHTGTVRIAKSTSDRPRRLVVREHDITPSDRATASGRALPPLPPAGDPPAPPAPGPTRRIIFADIVNL